MADYYVDINAADDTDTGALGHPKQKVQSGIDLCSAGDTLHIAAGTYTVVTGGSFLCTKGITIIGASAATTILNPTGATEGGFYTDGAISGTTITLQNLTLGTSAATGWGIIANLTAMNYALVDCIINDSADQQSILFFGSTGSLSLTNCTIGRGTLRSMYIDRHNGLTISGGSITGKILMPLAANSGAVSISDATITPNDQFLGISGAKTLGNVTIADCDITTHTSFQFIGVNSATTIGNLAITGNTVSALNSGSDLFGIDQKVGTVNISNNIITLGALATYNYVIWVGMQPADTPGTIGAVTVSGNTIQGTQRPAGAHGIYIGKGVSSATVKGNTITGGCTYGLVLKAGAGASVRGNHIEATICYLVKNGSDTCTIKGNKGVANKTGQQSPGDYDCAAMFIGGGDAVVSTDITITRNWFAGDSSDVTYVFYDYEGIVNAADMPTSGYDVDHNFYQNATGTALKLAYLNGAERDTAGNMHDAWGETWDGEPAGALAANDANSNGRAAIEDVTKQDNGFVV